jgi:ubiquinone/menaquinone biosynthesis C-methylase UbiE
VSQTNYENLLKRYAFYGPRYDRIFRTYSARTLGKALEVIPLHGPFRLIDVACGTGLLAEMLLKERPDLQFTGVDISPDMLTTARRRIPPQPGKIEWLQGTAERLPVGDEQFDVLTCTNAFHLVQDADAALAEFRRVIKPGGTLVLVDWCLDFPVMKVRSAALHIGDRQKRKIRRLHEMLDLVAKAGFQIDHSERFKPTRWWGLMCLVAAAPHPRAHHEEQQQGLRPAESVVAE